MRVGEDWLVRVSPQAGCAAATCAVRWTTDNRDVAKWLKSAPPCGNDRCGILEPVAPGTVRVTARVCNAVSCQAKSYDVEVVP